MSFEVPKSSLVTPLAFFGLSSLFAAVFTTRYPVENLLGMGGAYISAVVVATLGASLIRKASASQFVNALTGTGVALAVITLLQTVGYGPSRLLNVVFGTDLPHTNLFNVSGAPFVAAQFLGILLFAHILSFMTTRKLSTFQLISLPALIVGLALNVYLILPGKEASPALLPFGVSWSIATDVMKSPRSALIGIGQETYAAAYNQFRPSWTNSTEWWANSFGQASNVPLTLLTTAGLFGLASWIWLFVAVAKESRVHIKQHPVLVGVVLGTFIVQLFLPNNVVLLVLQATGLAYFIATAFKGVTKVHFFKTATFDNSFTSSQRSTVAFVLPIVIAGAVALVCAYGVGRAYTASYYFFRSSYALQQNDAANTYEMQRRAAEMNPYMSVYRSNYALTNLAIATALANKQDITEQETQEVAQLVQQAIREARAATILRPEDTQNWRVLAQVYRNLIGSAEGADQWAVSSYVEAITTNPADPTLRIELGGIFLSQEQYNDAILLFQQAAELKPDYANAYYNLANALKAANQLATAQAAYQQTLSLIPADSEDYVRVNQELEEVQAVLAQQQAAAEANGEGQEAANTQATSPASSLLNQNVSQTENEVVTQPANQPLNIDPNVQAVPQTGEPQPTQ